MSSGKIAANHSLGDIYAMGGTPASALAFATLPFGLDDKVEETLSQMMQGAQEVLGDAGAVLTGGHTSEGTDMALGFAVIGRVSRDGVQTKDGMVPGQDLILTKPAGTGALFAGDMRAKAKARWIDAAIRSMLQSSRIAGECLSKHGATAATDITGFGLIGHLVEMVEASDVAVEVDLDAVPLLEGAIEMIQRGIHSSLQPQNQKTQSMIANLAEVEKDPRFPLLFDPQTAGGLLASVPGQAIAGLRRSASSSGL